MKKLEPLSADLRFALLWLLSGLFEAPLMLLMTGFSSDLLRPWTIVLFHLAGAACAFFAPPKDKGWLHSGRHWGQSSGLVALLVPGAGWLACAWMFLRNRAAPFENDAYIFGDEKGDFNPTAGLGTPEAVRRQLADATNIMPAADALLRGDHDLKRGAIELLSRIRTPDSISWILKARMDPDPEIRFFATSALTRLKSEFESGVRAAEEEALRRPGDPAARLALQRVRYEYAVSGILDEQIRLSFLQTCRERLAGERDVHSARLLFLVESQLDPDRALTQLDRLEALDPDMRRRWLRERASLLFSAGRFGEVRRFLRSHQGELSGSGQGPDRAWLTASLFWETI